MSDVRVSLSRERSAKYIDLKSNGRLFPSWILANFKDYKLPEIIRIPGEDPCKETGTDKEGKIKAELKKYQIFISQYLDFRSPYQDILIYHGLGSGKTASAINIYNALYNYTPGWNVFMFIKASLKGTWLKELNTWLTSEEKEHRRKNIHFVHYDSPIADKQFMDIIKNTDSSKKSLYIFDEIHNFIRNVYSNISSTKGRRAQNIYDYIIQDKRDNPDTRVILLSGTPAINNPYELALLFNLLRPGIFPKSENDFNHLFVTTTTHQTMNNNSKNMFQRRIMGLVTFYLGHTPDVFASQSTHYVDVPMSDYQEDIYNYYDEIEGKLAAKARMQGKLGSQTYKSYTRQACNFVFPQISQRVNGETRPRPNKFRISEREAEKLVEGQSLTSIKADKDVLTNIAKYQEAMNSFIVEFDRWLTENDEKDNQDGHTIMKDVETMIKKYNGDYKEFFMNEKKKSKLFEAMHLCSAKFVWIIFNIMASKGPTIVYSNYVLMEGLQLLKVYLKYFGFYNYMEKMELIENRVGYVEFHGGIKDVATRYKGMDAYNNPNNKHGEFIKIMLISPAGAEGLSLMNVRQIHITEPYWNEVRITQMIGRGIRRCSHVQLKLEDRHVDIYRYRSLRTKINKWTTDQYIEDLARSKASLIQSFLDSMKEVAIDCVLNKNHNMMQSEYKCFQFEEPSLFTQYVGPAYKEDINDDIQNDNGSNSMNAVTMKIKVMEISAVKQISPPEDEKKEYSKPSKYWFYPKSGVVYDHELHYAIGKVAIDNDGLPVKLDKETYVIDQVIPIPLIDNK